MLNNTASAHMRAGMELFPTARELGHKGLLVDHRIYDRAIMSAMEKLWQRFDQAYYVFLDESLGIHQSHKLWLYHWRSVVGCFGHDCHGGLKWGIFEFLADKEVVRDAYIGVESNYLNWL